MINRTLFFGLLLGSMIACQSEETEQTVPNTAISSTAKNNANTVQKPAEPPVVKPAEKTGTKDLSQTLLLQKDGPTIQPTKDFLRMTKALTLYDFEPVKINSKDNRYGYEDGLIQDQYYVNVSKNHKWTMKTRKGMVVLEPVEVWESVYRISKAINGNMYPDFKLTEFQFVDTATASGYKEQMEAISKQIYDRPKHINHVWQVGNRYYLMQTRAAIFEDNYEEARSLLRKELKK